MKLKNTELKLKSDYSETKKSETNKEWNRMLQYADNE
jgi:hypothetical protein